MIQDLSRLCASVCEIAREAGAFIRKEQSAFSLGDIEVKGRHDFVTYVDKGAEKMIVSRLAEILPGSGFLAEEGTVEQSRADYTWIIDPLDGTTNFIHHMGPYSVSIALADSSNHILLGVVYEITLDECFYAWLGGGAYLNGNAIHVSKATDISASLIATGFPYYDYLRIKDFMKTLEHFFLHSHGVRRLGSAATDLAYVACGRFEAFYEYSLHPWDVAAGSILVSEAGGRVSDFSQNDNYLFGGEMIGSNQGIYSEFTGIIHQHMVNPERPQGS